MKRTISIRLDIIPEDDQKLLDLEEAYFSVCNQIVPFARDNRCWNRFALHNLVYSHIRKTSPLGSQMVCNAIFSVCKAYKAKGILPKEEVPLISFRRGRSVHFDKRTYKIKGETISLYTLGKRIEVKMRCGPFEELFPKGERFSTVKGRKVLFRNHFDSSANSALKSRDCARAAVQKEYFSQGVPKEGELICRKGKWYFNLVLDLPDPPLQKNTNLLGVDLGENNVFATSSGKIFSGGKIRHQRDQFLAKRRALQSNGSQSARQLLKKISGREDRCMRQTNHKLSKEIVQEAIDQNAGVIVLEELTNIRKRIKGGKRLRTRLHRWSFRQLQMFIQYKAEAKGLSVLYVNPAYSSQECSVCGCLGVRTKHLFTCSCGNQQHADWNASQNLCRFALGTLKATCAVNRTQVAGINC